MDVNELEEKKLIFGPMQYIYWEVQLNDVLYTISAFNNMSLMFHLANNKGMDAVLFPRLTDIEYTTIKSLFKIVLDLIIQSAKTYDGEKTEFIAYFLLQPYVGDMDEELENMSTKGIKISCLGDTKTGGTSFRKFEVQVDTKKL